MKDHTHIWKRRLRTTISSNPSDKQIILAICWSTRDDDAALPQKAIKDDPILWNIWCMRTGWRYKVWIERAGVMAHIDNADFKDEKDALAEYRRRAKEFPRSKDVDYGYPVDDTGTG